MRDISCLRKGRAAQSGLSLFILLAMQMLCGCIDVPYHCMQQGPLTLRFGAVEALTSGTGNDTEPACSPDGSRIAFQTDRKGNLDIVALDISTGKVAALVEGPGHACYPAWTPEGGLVYSFGNRTETAAQTQSLNLDKGFGLRYLKSGATEVLTQGLWRDYTPFVTADGANVYYTSTRTNTGNNASLWKLPLKGGAEPSCLLRLDGRNEGAVQPSLSKDGKVLIWSELNSFYENWRICAAFSDDLANSVALTPAEMSAYAPRLSPDGRLIAFTGFRPGDPAWRIYLLEPRSGAMIALDTGPANSRGPAWSPDGRAVIYENNSSGFYKICRIPVEYDIDYSGVPTPAKLPGSCIEGHLVIKEKKSLWVDGSGKVLPGRHPEGTENVNEVSGTSPVLFDEPAGMEYGLNTFYVRVKFRLDRIDIDTRIAAVGQYEENPRAWQVFVRPTGFVVFSSRDPDGKYVGVSSDAPYKPGAILDVAGVRDESGTLRLWINGVLQSSKVSGASFDYVHPLRVGLGVQYDGKLPLSGRVFEFETGRGWAPGLKPPPTRQDIFKEVRP